MSEVQVNKEQPTHALFEARWSPRAFDLTKEVAKHDVLSCLEAARWAPSCFGEEPWRFIVCDKQEDEQRWQTLLSCLVPKNQAWSKQAQVLMMVCSKLKFSHNGNDNRWAEYDAGQAAVSLCLQATALGLVTHQMGGFDPAAIREKFNISADIQPIAAIALGHLGQSDHLDDEFKAAELKARARKPLADLLL